MEMITLLDMETIRYKNNGQEAERRFRFTLTGEDCKADNIPANKGCDLGNISIKSARASVCRGTDIDEHLRKDCAERFAYVTKGFTRAYIMERAKYKEFVELFSTVGHESKKNGGGLKLRLKDEPRAMLEWLEAQMV